MEDTITITFDTGEKKQAKLVSMFNIQNMGDYMIYLLDDKMYGAKYKKENDKLELITDLTDEEKEAMNKVFEQMEVDENA